MNLDVVVAQLRALVPDFGGRVGGAIDYFRAKDQGWLDSPAAYVIPLGDEAEATRDQTDYYQLFTERLSVVVVLDNAGAVASGDRRGQAASRQFDPFKWALFKALLNWNPNSIQENPGVITSDTPGANHSGRGLYYVESMPTEGPDGSLARSLFRFDFALDVTIGGDDVWQPTGVPLTEVDITIENPDTHQVLTGEIIPLEGA